MKDNSEIANELDDACFNDLRLSTRSKKIIQLFYNGVGNSIPAACKSSAETKAAYGFFRNKNVTPEKILRPHQEKTVERIKEQETILFISDSSDLNAKHMTEVEDLGRLNDKTRPGCLLHTTIACTPERLFCGIIQNKVIKRKKEEIGSSKAKKQLPIEEKESYKWIQSYQKGVEIAKQATGTKFIYIADREADIIELFAEFEKHDQKVDILVRASHDRSVKFESESENEIVKTSLKKVESQTAVMGHINFTTPSREGKKAREVKQEVRAQSIEIQKPFKKQASSSPQKMNVVFLRETEPPEGENPVCWTLLTTLPINTIDEVKYIIKLYLARWSIEVFFHILKNGCRIEKLQFKTAASLLNCVTLYMIIAWRVYFVTFLGRNCPDLPCEVIFEKDEWQVLYTVVKKAKAPEDPPSLGEVVRLVATLGGFLGRKQDKDPGPKVMWIGLQKLYHCVEGWKAFREFGQLN